MIAWRACSSVHAVQAAMPCVSDKVKPRSFYSIPVHLRGLRRQINGSDGWAWILPFQPVCACRGNVGAASGVSLAPEEMPCRSAEKSRLWRTIESHGAAEFPRPFCRPEAAGQGLSRVNSEHYPQREETACSALSARNLPPGRARPEGHHSGAAVPCN